MASATPFQSTVDADTKLPPLTVSVNAAEPAVVLLGDKDEIEGAGFTAVIVKVCAFDVPPPGAGLTTVTMGVPLVATSEAGTEAVSCEALTYVVVSAVPFQSTVEDATKSLPLTVRVNAVDPAATLDGEIEEIEGTGLTAVIVNDEPLEVPPPGVGLTTVIVAVPVVVTSDAGTDAVSFEALT